MFKKADEFGMNSERWKFPSSRIFSNAVECFRDVSTVLWELTMLSTQMFHFIVYVASWSSGPASSVALHIVRTARVNSHTEVVPSSSVQEGMH
mgnify:CR=1 FL=1